MNLTAHSVALVVVSIASIVVGYYAGRNSPGRNSDSPKKTLDEDEVDSDDGDLSAITAGLLEPCKLVLIVRTDLKMTPGKISAQCGHATLACYKALAQRNPQLVKHWERTGQAKIALKATSEKQLQELETLAKSLNLCARSVQDQGLTQVEPGSRTVLAIGPAPVELVNRVTGKLRLL
ncbi:peptidyl-tRNA hydrolase PTH2-domain-containing protein [Mycena rebaudengoi]|nr:peptidyl-tRNA hydrolase PTH2-domain-containing protein [Mycena rebaudengoi]